MNFQPKFPANTVEVSEALKVLEVTDIADIADIADTETLNVVDEEKSFTCAPRLSLPQIVPSQTLAKRRHPYTNVPQFRAVIKNTPFPFEPQTLMDVQSLNPSVPTEKGHRHTGPQIPFPTPSLDFSSSLRAGITYIPPTMIRRKEPTMTDALIACTTLLFLGLVIIMFLYYFSF